MKRSLAAAVAAVLTLALAPSAFAAGADYVPGEVVVKYEDDATAAQKSAAQRLGGVVERITGVRGVGAKLVSVAGGVQAAVARLESSAAVEYAEPNYIYRAQATPNDPLFPQMYGLHNTGQTGGTEDADIDAPEGWDSGGLGTFPSTGGAKVGIVDTGIQLSHPEFAGGRVTDCAGVNNFGINLIILLIGSDPTIVDGKCADDNGHGTHVAGTIAANTNNATGVAGVSPSSPLAVCKALNSSGAGTLVMVANCIDWTNQRGAKIISMSLGSTAGAATLQQATQRATNNGSLVIAAAGNGGNPTPNYPAAYPEVVSVGATDHNDQRASFSTFNSDVEVSAPGVDVLSTWNNGGYRDGSGTSMATPHAAGVAAVIATQRPSLSVAGLRAKLQTSVDDKGAAGRDPEYGFGRVNLLKATTGP
ncbi:MAG TPA: S8 family serine peptidase [Solirubrobacterales bacterium]|nr:S8 family serine peptidase [Solirubrobacterales bacterium]